MVSLSEHSQNLITRIATAPSTRQHDAASDQKPHEVATRVRRTIPAMLLRIPSRGTGTNGRRAATRQPYAIVVGLTVVSACAPKVAQLPPTPAPTQLQQLSCEEFTHVLTEGSLARAIAVMPSYADIEIADGVAEQDAVDTPNLQCAPDDSFCNGFVNGLLIGAPLAAANRIERAARLRELRFGVERAVLRGVNTQCKVEAALDALGGIVDPSLDAMTLSQLANSYAPTSPVSPSPGVSSPSVVSLPRRPEPGIDGSRTRNAPTDVRLEPSPDAVVTSLQELMRMEGFDTTGLDRLSRQELTYFREWVLDFVAALSLSEASACSPTSKSTIADSFLGWDSDTIVQMTNGEVWQQDSQAYSNGFRYRPEAIVFSLHGECVMLVEGTDEAVAVVAIGRDGEDPAERDVLTRPHRRLILASAQRVANMSPSVHAVRPLSDLFFGIADEYVNVAHALVGSGRFDAFGLERLTPSELLPVDMWLYYVAVATLRARSDRGGCSPAFQGSIQGFFEGWNGETVIELASGQAWEQSSFHINFRHLPNPDVYVFSLDGSCQMFVEGTDQPVSVEQLR